MFGLLVGTPTVVPWNGLAGKLAVVVEVVVQRLVVDLLPLAVRSLSPLMVVVHQVGKSPLVAAQVMAGMRVWGPNPALLWAAMVSVAKAAPSGRFARSWYWVTIDRATIELCVGCAVWLVPDLWRSVWTLLKAQHSPVWTFVCFTLVQN